MDLESIIARLRKAHIKHSLRQIGKFCDVNHETIRKLILSKATNITCEVYVKLDKGLKEHGL